MLLVRFASLAPAAVLAGCITASSGDVIRFSAQSPSQTVVLREGDAVITSRGQMSQVTLKPATRQVVNRPVFVVGIENVSRVPVDFLLSNIAAYQKSGGQTVDLKVFSFGDLMQEEQSAQVGRTLLVGIVGGLNSGLAGRNTYAQDRADDQNALLATRVAAQGQQNVQEIEELSLKDHTLAPGESYAGKLHVQSPVQGDAKGTKYYSITMQIGRDRHVFEVAQGSM